MAKYSPSGSPPDVTACIFWLKNRDPRHWRDSQQMEHVLGKYIISDKPMSEEERARERADVLDLPGAPYNETQAGFGDGREEASLACRFTSGPEAGGQKARRSAVLIAQARHDRAVQQCDGARFGARKLQAIPQS
jgi:hypothetical protein